MSDKTPAQIMWADEDKIAHDLQVQDQLREELALLESRAAELRSRLYAVKDVWRIENHHLLERSESKSLPMFGPGVEISSRWCFTDDRYHHWFAYFGERDGKWVVVGLRGKGVAGGGCYTTPPVTFETEAQAEAAAIHFATHRYLLNANGEAVEADIW